MTTDGGDAKKQGSGQQGNGAIKPRLNNRLPSPDVVSNTARPSRI